MYVTAKPDFTFHQWLRDQYSKGEIECVIMIKEMNENSIDIVAETSKKRQGFHIYKDTIYSEPENVVEPLVSQLWYSRDASWWDRPNTNKPKKLHLMVGMGFSLCGLNMLLNKEDEWENPPEAMKCKGCKNKKVG